MAVTPASSAVFDFENILPQLDFLPIAARRALDHAGLRLSLEAWRSLGLDDRCQLVAAGAFDLVDSNVVAQVVRRASPPAQRIEVVGDPDPIAPPDGLMRLLEPIPLDPRQWARLRALDRYALAHVHRRSIARNDPTLIQAAYEDIVTGHLRSLRPPPGEAGGRSMGSTTPPPEVPPPPGLPRDRFDRARADGDNDREWERTRAYDMTASPGRVQDAFHESAEYDQSFGSEHDAEPASSSNRHEDGATAAVSKVLRPGRVYPPAISATGFAPQASRGSQDVYSAERAHEPGRGRGQSPSKAPYRDAPSARTYESSRADRHSSLPPLGIENDVPELTPLAPSVLSNHLSAAGEAQMVHVGEKAVTNRRAVACAVIHMRQDTFRRLAQRDTPKGDVLAAARIAGIQGAKRTSDLIPLCHPIALTSVEVHLELDGENFCVQVTAVANAFDRTGVEMEALMAASIAALTIYDMLKGIDREMVVSDVKLLEKSGGRGGHYTRRDG